MRVTGRCTFHGEGVYWDEPRQRLLLVDMLAGAVVELGPDLVPLRHEYGGIAAVIRRRAAGGYVLAVERGFRFLDEDLVPTGETVEVFDDPSIRMNEGGCDPQGRLHVGTMAYDTATGRGAVYRMGPDRSVAPVLNGVTISNGLQWSADGGTAFYVDTPTDHVWRFRYDPTDGTFHDREPFIDLSDVVGHPDGMTIDEEGGLWVAMYGGWAVRRFDGAGVLSDVVELPTRDVTCATFGGAERSTLFITTSRDGWGEEHAEPEAGSVFAFETDVRGARQHPYAG
ncbi:MAG: SMP-30/gluconolactonase/LRE family protein [Acidobacteria bacterium]|nr:SMP-30/gluconolactonase/LRE family protein [Acidobacteriota bacterium]